MKIDFEFRLNVLKLGRGGERFQRSESPIIGYESTFTIYEGFMRNNFPRGDDSFIDEYERQRDKEKSRRKKGVPGSAIIATGTYSFPDFNSKVRRTDWLWLVNDNSQPFCSTPFFFVQADAQFSPLIESVLFQVLSIISFH